MNEDKQKAMEATGMTEEYYDSEDCYVNKRVKFWQVIVNWIQGYL
jgi:hypothetical protein